MSAWNESDLSDKQRAAIGHLDPATLGKVPVIPQAVAANPKSKMNGLETRYSLYLDREIKRGLVAEWRFEAVNLRLADNTFYRPDFMVIKSTGHIEFHETKGFWREDARVKIKVAATAFPWFTFVAVQEKQGTWVFENFRAR